MSTIAVAQRSGLTKWQALNVMLLVSGYAGYYLCRSNLSVTMPLIAAEMVTRGMDANTARVTLGSIASLGVLAYAIGKFPSGSLADLFGGKTNFLAGMGGSIAFTLLFAATGSLPVFTLAWIGNRLAQSLGWAGVLKITSRWFSFRSYGTVMGIVSLSYLFGDAAARQFMGMLISAGLGWRAVFFTTALVLGTLFIACTRLRESPSQVGEAEPIESPGNLFASAKRDDAPDGLADLLRPFLRNHMFWLACALSLGMTLLRETFGLWTPTYFTQSAGMTPGEAASASALFPFFGGLSVLLCGWLSDRLGRGSRAALSLGGLLLAGLVLLILAARRADSSFLPVILVSAVAFLIIGPYSFLSGAMSLDFGGKRGSGTASGFIDGIGYIGGVLAGNGMASVSIKYGWSGAFFALAVVAFMSSAAAAFLLRSERNGSR